MTSVVSIYLPPPPGFNYLASIEACYTFVLISLPLTAILVPILLLILFFSTPSSRRTLMFGLNVLIVLLGIAEGVLSTVVQSLIILQPQQILHDRLFLTYITFAFYTPIIVDCVLILRLSAVYPASITPRTARLAILTVPLLCTVARFACVSVLLHDWATLGQQYSSALFASIAIWPQNPMIIADWAVQLFENMYCSILFLCRLRGHKAFSSRMYRNQSIAARLRALFYIAISNFVFPSIFSIGQLVYIIRDPSVVHGATVLMVNNYVSITCVVFSTIWCSSDVWKGTHNIPPSFGRDARNVEASFPQSMITLSGIAPNITLGPPESRSPPVSSLYVRSHETSRSLSRGHRPHPFANATNPTGKDERDPGSTMNLARAMRECDREDHMPTLALPEPNPDVDDDSASETPSRSPITPCDPSVHVDANDAKQWEDVGSPPCTSTERCPNVASESDSGADVGIELEFATPSPPLSNRYWERRRSRSRSSYRDTPEAYDSLSEARVSDGRHSQPFVNSRRPSPSPSPSHAHRPSFMEWSDGGGTQTPSCDCSLQDP